MPYCLSCGSMVDEYDSAYYARNMSCISCYVRKTSEVRTVSCARCGVRVREFEAKERKGNRYCFYCYNELERIEALPVCIICKGKIERYQEIKRLVDGRALHLKCIEEEKRKPMGRGLAFLGQ